MNLTLKRLRGYSDYTLGVMAVDGVFECFTLEDEYRAVKVMHETRIPAGEYDIKLRDVGGMTQKYAAKYGDMHQGMIWLQDVDNFTFVYIHAGNTDEHTSGCIIVGDTAEANMDEDGFVGKSAIAYRRLYKKIIDVINSGKSVTIKIEECF